MLKVIDSHTRFNSYMINHGLSISQKNLVASNYITECKIKRFIKSLSDSDIVNKMSKNSIISINQFKDDLLYKVQRMNTDKLNRVFNSMSNGRSKALDVIISIKL